MAAAASGIPQPIRLFGVPAFEAVAFSQVAISRGVAAGRALRMRAATPAMRGEENEVPCCSPYAVSLTELATRTSSPCAMTSGFIRGGIAVVGPTELKAERAPEGLTAPAVMTESASAGAFNVL